jgi:hypothetical protein
MAIAPSFILWSFSILLAGAASITHIGSLRFAPTADRESFNPAIGERVTFRFEINHSAAITARIIDQHGQTIRTLLHKATKLPGPHMLVWDGRNDARELVPDDAYTISLQPYAVPDTLARGGVVGDITEATLDESGSITYSLPAAARVLIRLGIKNGPMLRTLVDWKPRAMGKVVERWDGWDESKVLRLRDEKDLSVLITYVTLPQPSVLTYGHSVNPASTSTLAPSASRRPRPPVIRLDLAPQSSKGVTTPRTSIPTVDGSAVIRVDVEPEDKAALVKEPFEMIFYVDKLFFAEAERGYLPLNWQWDLKQLPPGEHTLTVNIVSFSGNVGVASRRVMVKAKNE